MLLPDQFILSVQSTRLICIQDHSMMSNHQAPLQFPQPTEPVHAQDTLHFQSFQTTPEEQTSFVVDDHYDHLPQNNYYYYYYNNNSDSDDEKNYDHKFLKKLHAKVEEEIMSLKTTIKDGDVERNQILGLFKKFGDKLHKKIMKNSGDRGVIIQERGVVDIEVDQKLERFKVKTVNLGSGGEQVDNAEPVSKK